MTDHYTPRTEDITGNAKNPVGVIYLLANLIVKILGKELELVRATKLINMSRSKLEVEETTELTLVVKRTYELDLDDH